MESDEQCVRSCLDGHPAAFRHLVQRYQSPLTRCLYARLGNVEEATEAAQETFVRAYFALSELRKPASFFSWLLGIGDRVAKESRRTAGRRRRVDWEQLKSAQPADKQDEYADTAVIERIEYDKPIDAEVFSLKVPENVAWYQEPQRLVDNEKYEKMTPKEAAQAFFEACGKQDWKEAGKFRSPIDERFKGYLGGVEIVSLGEPFRSERYPGWFVPYEIKLKTGHVKKHNLAVRKDNPAKRYIVDGGI